MKRTGKNGIEKKNQSWSMFVLFFFSIVSTQTPKKKKPSIMCVVRHYQFFCACSSANTALHFFIVRILDGTKHVRRLWASLTLAGLQSKTKTLAIQTFSD